MIEDKTAARKTYILPPKTGVGYHYGFNGMEKTDELFGEGDAYDYGMRGYDARAGRFWSVDPLSGMYPYLSPYQFASNSPILGIDRDGLEFGAANIGVGFGFTWGIFRKSNNKFQIALLNKQFTLAMSKGLFPGNNISLKGAINFGEGFKIQSLQTQYKIAFDVSSLDKGSNSNANFSINGNASFASEKKNATFGSSGEGTTGNDYGTQHNQEIASLSQTAQDLVAPLESPEKSEEPGVLKFASNLESKISKYRNYPQRGGFSNKEQSNSLLGIKSPESVKEFLQQSKQFKQVLTTDKKS